MLGVLCARPKPWLLPAALSSAHAYGGISAAAHVHNRIIASPIFRSVIGCGSGDQKRHHSSSCRLGGFDKGGGAASIWHGILPTGDGNLRRGRRSVIYHHHHDEFVRKGEGSWNVVWDARPARWLHNLDSAWLLFGVCACLTAPLPPLLEASEVVPDSSSITDNEKGDVLTPSQDGIESSSDFRVTGVTADGRCLFRAVAHVASLRRGEEVPDENRQKELADGLRAQVVEELFRRRKEAEWYLESDFDAYVQRIKKPYVWGGEPELLMASHVIKTPISVYMIDKSSGSLTNIANYGKEYRKDEESPINILFHGYGHYDILEFVSKDLQKVEA